MGLFDNLISLFDQGKCFVGFHDWKSWSKKQSGNCDQTHICSRCQKKETKTNHDWRGWKYTEDNLCGQERECLHCNKIEKRVEHIWDKWDYKAPRTCDRIRFCRRCNEKQEEQAEKNDHTYGEFKRISCYESRRRCMRCDFEDVSELTKSMGSYSKYDQGDHKFVVANDHGGIVCSECGYRHDQRSLKERKNG